MGGREERDGGGGGERRRWGARFYFLAAVKWGPGRRRPRPPRRVAFSRDDRASGGGGDHLEMRRVERRQRLQIGRGERGRGQRRARVEGRARAGAQKGRMDAEGSNGSAGDGAARTESTRAGRKHDRISHRSSYPHPSRRRVRSRCPAMARTRCAQSCVADAWLPFKNGSRRAPNSRLQSSREPPNVRTAIHPPLPMHVSHYPSFTEPESDVTATHATRHDALSDLSARVEKKKSGKDRRRPTQHIS